MKQKGSMTIAMSLMLLAFLPLIAVTIRASQTACARVQSVNGIDTALYSLFQNMIRNFWKRTICSFLTPDMAPENWISDR